MSKQSASNSKHPSPNETHATWERIAAWWDNAIGEGNEFQRELIMPATDRLLALKPGEVVLDIACGNGNYSRRMARAGAKVVAFDGAATFIERAKPARPTRTATSNIWSSTPPTNRPCYRSAKTDSMPPCAAWR